MNRIAWLIAIGYVALALVSVGIYAASTAKFVDYAQTHLVFSSGRLLDGTFVRLADRWTVTLHWRFENRGHLPYTLASFQFQFAVDNTSDSRLWSDPTKIATEYTNFLSFYQDRYSGPVVPPGGTTDHGWVFNVTIPADIAKIAPSASDGKFYIAVFDGRTVYYIADTESRWQAPLGPSYTGV